ncbi:MAG: PQQ-binding-like beta-propeller repeat protein [Deinococcales bacterium]
MDHSPRGPRASLWPTFVLTSLLLAATLVGCAAAQGAGASTGDWTRFGFDAVRSGVSTAPTGITPGNVQSLAQHEQRVSLPGTVDASPIYLHGVAIGGATHDAFFVTTTYGKTLAIDAGNGRILWTFTPSGYGSYAGSYRITTATPVADPSRSAIYAADPDGMIHKLSVADGRVLWSTSVTRLPGREKIASALNLVGRHVIVTTGGYIGDAPPYQGHVAVLDASSGKLLRVWNSLCSDKAGLLDPGKDCAQSDSAIWGRAGAVVDPSSQDIFVATGNAPWNGTTDWGDAVLELSPDASTLLGNYTPTNTDYLNAADLDLGSTSPALLGDGYIAQGGKDGVIRVLDWSKLLGTAPHREDASQTVPTPSGGKLFTALAVWHHGGQTWLFAADNGGTAAWTFAGGRLHPAWKTGSGGTSPVLAGGLLYVYDPGGSGLRVYEPTSGDVMATLPAGRGHWNSPIVIDGRIALPEGNANSHRTSGVLDIWRLP